MFIARNSEASVMIEPKFFSGLLEQDLERRMVEKFDGDNVSGSVLTNVDNKMAFGDVERETRLVVMGLISA